MKGSLILTEGRSGSNWLISLTNGTNVLGVGGEWFSNSFLKDWKEKTQTGLVDRALANASTPNGYFCVKLFPAHLHLVQIRYGFDLLKHFVDTFDVNLVRLTRADRFRQAISYARGLQTNQWTRFSKVKGEARYDFDMICRCYFLISRSDAYWDAYLGIRNLDSSSFVYEDLLDDPRSFVDCLADHAGCQVNQIPQSKLSIQRDGLTEEWLARFTEDVRQRGIVEQSAPSRQPRASASNLLRLLRGAALKPYPYNY